MLTTMYWRPAELTEARMPGAVAVAAATAASMMAERSIMANCGALWSVRASAGLRSLYQQVVRDAAERGLAHAPPTNYPAGLLACCRKDAARPSAARVCAVEVR